MKKEARLLRDRSVNSLVLAIELFNRPHDRGRIEGALIFIDHAFELLLKSCMITKGAKIRDSQDSNTIGFDACVRRSLSTDGLQFINDDEAITMQAINGLRDAAQHHIVDVTEEHLYIHIQSGLTVYRDIFHRVFNENLHDSLPERVLPISTTPPRDITSIFQSEVDALRSMLEPGKRRSIDALAKVRGLAILENSVVGSHQQPSNIELTRICKHIREGKPWDEIFPGVAMLQVTQGGDGAQFSLRIVKKDGMPIQIVSDTAYGAVAIKRVNELDFYQFGLYSIADLFKVNRPHMWAVIQELELQKNQKYFKEFEIGTQKHKRYSQEAVHCIREALPSLDIAAIWDKWRVRRGAK